MLQALQTLFFGIALLSFLSMVLGLVKPVLVLWFLDRFNRLKVIKFYGIPFVISFLLGLAIRFLLS